MDYYHTEYIRNYKNDTEVVIPLSDYSAAAKACYAASLYGRSVDKPCTFMRGIYCENIFDHSHKYWRCPDCNGEWKS